MVLPTGSLPELCAVVFMAKLNELQKVLSDLRMFRLLPGQAIFLSTGCSGKRKVQVCNA